MEQPLPEQDSEDFLVQQAIQRDRRAFTALYDRHVDRVYRHVYYKVSNQADAEDITQEAFVKAWKAIHKYKRTEAPFIAWLITIARNLIADHYKKRTDHINLDDVVEKSSSQPLSDPERLAEIGFNQDLVKQAVLKLEGDKQKVIMLRFIDGFSYEEIARSLNKSEGAIRVIQCRALNELRRWVKRD